MTDWTSIYNWQMAFVGIAGLVLTVLSLDPGSIVVGGGPLRIDPFYVLTLSFLVISLWSIAMLRKETRRSE